MISSVLNSVSQRILLPDCAGKPSVGSDVFIICSDPVCEWRFIQRKGVIERYCMVVIRFSAKSPRIIPYRIRFLLCIQIALRFIYHSHNTSCIIYSQVFCQIPIYRIKSIHEEAFLEQRIYSSGTQLIISILRSQVFPINI